MELFEWYGGLSPWIRFGVALFFLLVSTVLWLAGVFFPYGWGVGLILLVFAFPYRSEKKGYHDF